MCVLVARLFLLLDGTTFYKLCTRLANKVERFHERRGPDSVVDSLCLSQGEDSNENDFMTERL